MQISKWSRGALPRVVCATAALAYLLLNHLPLAVGSPKTFSSRQGTRLMRLGFGSVSIRIPSSFSVDVQPGGEILWYRLTDPTDRVHFHYMQVAVTGSDLPIEPDGQKKHICLNGLRGIKATEGHDVAVVLGLPRATRMYSILFAFSDGDEVASRIVNSVAVSSSQRRCTKLMHL